MNEAVKAHEAAVIARWQVIKASGRLARLIETVNKEAIPLKLKHQPRVNAVLTDPAMSTAEKIEAMWQMADELGAIAAPHAACRKGCSHCCHISVLISGQEAELIGEKIGVKPAKVKGNTGPRDIEAGYHNPCPFLKDGACSIYESRPFVCRKLINIDTDALLCELVGRSSEVPYMNLNDYEDALVRVTIKRRTELKRHKRTGKWVSSTVLTRPDIGDIREFFPRGKP
jgi:uncharacterized protein